MCAMTCSDVSWLIYAYEGTRSCDDNSSTLMSHRRSYEGTHSYDVSSFIHAYEGTHERMTHSCDIAYAHNWFHESCHTYERVKWHLRHNSRDTLMWHNLCSQLVSCMPLQGGVDAWDALRCRSLSAKEPLIIGLLCENNLCSQLVSCMPLQGGVDA